MKRKRKSTFVKYTSLLSYAAERFKHSGASVHQEGASNCSSDWLLPKCLLKLMTGQVERGGLAQSHPVAFNGNWGVWTQSPKSCSNLVWGEQGVNTGFSQYKPQAPAFWELATSSFERNLAGCETDSRYCTWRNWAWGDFSILNMLGSGVCVHFWT